MLVTISGAQTGRLLAPARKALEIRGISTSRAEGASLRSRVPVQTHFDRKAVKPGDFACDPVELNRRLNEGVERLLQLNGERAR